MVARRQSDGVSYQLTMINDQSIKEEENDKQK
jgi:hypothetical protein